MRPQRRCARHLAPGDDRGAVAAELVVATPLLLLLILAVVQFALWQHASHVADVIAQQGLAAARVQGGSPAAGRSEADAVYTQLGQGLIVHPTVTATEDATTDRVVVTGHVTSVIPFLSLPVRAVAVGPHERFVPDVAAAGP